MNRKEFIYHIINKALKPAIYLALLILGVFFLINSYKKESGIERGFLFGTLIVIAVLFVMNMLSLLSDAVWKKVPEKAKLLIKKSDTILFFILLPFLIYLIYIKWNETNKWGLIGFIAVSLFLYFKNKKNKTKPI
ncbi:MAG: hypothetical protein QM710_00680 [Flavobacterium sp.]